MTGTPRKVQHREVEIFLITQYHLGWEVSSHGTWNRDETIVKKLVIVNCQRYIKYTGCP